MYELIGDVVAIAEVVRIWRDKMGADRAGNVALPQLGLWGRIEDAPRPSQGRDKFHSSFRLQPAGHPDVVLINIPSGGINENVLGAIGRDAIRRPYILRQGHLHGFKFTDFPKHTTLTPVRVAPSPDNLDRKYYTVACVDDPAGHVQAMTAAFVVECNLVRRCRNGQLTKAETRQRALADVIRKVPGAPEEHATHWRGATDGQEIIRRQTPVWQALKTLLGDRMSNPVIERLGVDALIDRPGGLPLLVEIKTDASAASLERGLGQLLLYGGLFERHPEGSAVELVLLLPCRPRSVLERLLSEHGVTIATYEDTEPPTFHPDFLALCRYAP